MNLALISDISIMTYGSVALIYGMVRLSTSDTLRDAATRLPSWIRFLVCLPVGAGLELLTRLAATGLADDQLGAVIRDAAIRVVAPFVFVASATALVPFQRATACAILGAVRLTPLLFYALGAYNGGVGPWAVVESSTVSPLWASLCFDVAGVVIIAVYVALRNQEPNEESLAALARRIHDSLSLGQRFASWVTLTLLLSVLVFPIVATTDYRRSTDGQSWEPARSSMSRRWIQDANIGRTEDAGRISEVRVSFGRMTFEAILVLLLGTSLVWLMKSRASSQDQLHLSSEPGLERAVRWRAPVDRRSFAELSAKYPEIKGVSLLLSDYSGSPEVIRGKLKKAEDWDRWEAENWDCQHEMTKAEWALQQRLAESHGTEKANAQGIQRASDGDVETVASELRKNLLGKVLGNWETSERLIAFEQEKYPNATRAELIQLAIERWERDNR